MLFWGCVPRGTHKLVPNLLKLSSSPFSPMSSLSPFTLLKLLPHHSLSMAFPPSAIISSLSAHPFISAISFSFSIKRHTTTTLHCTPASPTTPSLLIIHSGKHHEPSPSSGLSYILETRTKSTNHQATMRKRTLARFIVPLI